MLFACRSNGHMFHQWCFCRIELLYLYIVFILQKIHGCGRLTKKGRWCYSTVPSPSRILFVCASVSVLIISCISRQATQGWEFKIAAHVNGWYFTSEILQRHLRKFLRLLIYFQLSECNQNVTGPLRCFRRAINAFIVYGQSELDFSKIYSSQIFYFFA